jgi:OOP family OmpA-OmpF porin
MDSYGECVKSPYKQSEGKPPCVGEVRAEKRVMIEKATLEADANFDFDKSNLKPQGKKNLDSLVSKMSGTEIRAVDVVGHTDSIGTDAYNQRLSERRASTVKNYLIDKGVPGSVISAEGRGESQPVADNKTKEGRAQNRRVEVAVEAVEK